jgi:hypothetical protein
VPGPLRCAVECTPPWQRHPEAPQLAMTAVPDADLHLARLGHREDVEGDEWFHGHHGRAGAAGKPDSTLRQYLLRSGSTVPVRDGTVGQERWG